MSGLSMVKRSAVLITSAFVAVVALIGDTLPWYLEILTCSTAPEVSLARWPRTTRRLWMTFTLV
jgi:hypothetical protein